MGALATIATPNNNAVQNQSCSWVFESRGSDSNGLYISISKWKILAKVKKIAWIQSHHLHQGVKEKHSWALSTNF